VIPPVIHYAWFGGKPLPPHLQRCVDSFRRFQPQFTVKQWDETSFDPAITAFSGYALSRKKWAFVADVCRAFVLNSEGGFFLDADNELTASIDLFRSFEFVSGFEQWRGLYQPITAFMGAEPDSRVTRFLVRYYQRLHTRTFAPNTQFISRFMRDELRVKPDNSLQLIDRTLVAPSWFFCAPLPGMPNYCVHHFEATWW
jgi:mannosyltransferase OCH1-like enzyme